MRLSNRLSKLEPPAIERWHDSWDEFLEAMEHHTPVAVDKRLGDTPAARLSDDELEQAIADDDPATAANEISEALPGLAVREMVQWFHSYELPDIDKPDLSHTPLSIPIPPPEPVGLWEELEQRLADESDTGTAAAVMLFILAVARSVCEYRQNTQECKENVAHKKEPAIKPHSRA